MDTNLTEIDEGAGYIGYQEAFNLVGTNVKKVGIEEMPLALCTGRVAAEDLVALVSYPSVDVSLKDGFAVRSQDVANASRQHPAHLRVAGAAFAGSGFGGEVTPGSAVKVCSGAPVPQGSDAIVSGEFCEEVSRQEVFIRANAETGRNVLRAGAEVQAGTTITRKNEVLLPGRLGLAAAAGINFVRVYRRPRVAVIGIGDEVVAPGGHLHPGQLYASNLVTMVAWLTSFGISCDTSVVRDNKSAIKRALVNHLPNADAILTSGGAWSSEHDLVVKVLNELGWQEIFHHIRMGPGKGIAFGLWSGKPVFCLPGGPASNEMAFLQLALPGLLRVGGESRHPLPTVSARLTETVSGRNRAWTEFKDATLTHDAEGNHVVRLYRSRSRLQAIAHANCLICIPEGTDSLDLGDIISVQMLVPRLDNI
ncbi:MAG: hypothetical protein A2144_12760 [Chloroflexi bacterium RBG_16_50_9]|nr:MAG: hypothetical protein A2144_12760 [Chloroflexi bacterium RBG_16_50_9]